MNLSDYVKVYDNTLPPQYCVKLIRDFEAYDKKHYQDDGVKRFTEINLMQAGFDYMPLLGTIQQYKARYWKECGLDDRNVQPNHSWEEIRMKRYLPHIDEFRPHCDTWNGESMKRFLVYFWYLNDVAEGGETELYNLDRPVKVQPKRARLIMFPTGFQYLHAGLMPKSGSKYIVGGYLHYS